MSAAPLTMLVGSYTASSGGHAAGISLVRSVPHDADADAGHGEDAYTVTTAAVIDDPSFLALDGDRLYAVSEASAGSVHAFRFDGAHLEHLWDITSGGDSPCHLAVRSDGSVLVANYVSGSVALLSAAGAISDGDRVRAALLTAAADEPHGAETVTRLQADLIRLHPLPPATGPVSDRQEGPHAHQTLETDRGTVLVADLGGDALHELRIESDGSIAPLHVHPLAPGTGPRHMVWHDGSLFVTGELDGRVHRLERDEHGRLVERRSASAVEGPSAEALLSHIDVDESGRLYAAVRGPDTIAVFDTANGGLRRLASVPTGGAWPRHFARVDGFLLVANERSDAITVLPLDADGIPGQPIARIPVGSPTCVLPVGR